MGLIAREWTIETCSDCEAIGSRGPLPTGCSHHHAERGAIEVVPASQLRGAVEALRIAREYVEASDLRQSSVDLSVIDEALDRFGGAVDTVAVIERRYGIAGEAAGKAALEYGAGRKATDAFVLSRIARAVVDALEADDRGAVEAIRTHKAAKLQREGAQTADWALWKVLDPPVTGGQ